MPDWLPPALTAVLAALVTALAKDWLYRRKTSAEAEQAEAQADKIAGEAWQDLIATIRDQYTTAVKENAELRARHDTDMAVIRLLHEQKAHAEAYMTILVTKIAALEGRTFHNGEDDGAKR